MKAKTKLIATIMSICLVCAVFAIGVFALKTANLKIGGDVSFKATGVEANIRNAKLYKQGDEANASIYAVGDITTSMTQSDIDSKFQNWQSLDLTFDKNATDLVFCFEIANMSTSLNNYIEIDYNYTFNNNDPNVGYTFDADTYLLAPKGEAENGTYTTVTITFNVKDDELNVPEGTKFDMTIALKHQNPKLLTTTNNKYYYEDIEYSLDTSDYTATVVGWQNDPTEVVFPSVVTDGSDNFVVTSFDGLALSGCSLTSITIPSSVINLGESTFSYCYDLTSVTLANGLKSLGDSIFAYCEGLTTITIPDSVTSIEGTFCGCTSLTSVTIGSGVKSIDDGGEGGAFEDCGFATITIPDGVTDIGGGAFWGCDLAAITIPDSVTSIGKNAFANCDFTEITIPEGVTSIAGGAFRDCNYISVINYNAKNASFYTYRDEEYDDEDDCFEVIVSPFYDIGAKAESLTVNIGDNVETIPSYFLYKNDYYLGNNKKITTITIPASVTSIGAGAFSGCTNLTSVEFENPNGWWVASSSTATSGTSVAISTTNFASNATLFKSTYRNYYWHRDA